MAYTTVDGVINRYKPLETMIGTGSTDVTTTDIASVYIADAESIVNAYVGARYVIPLGPEPLLTSLSSDIAIYKMLEDKAPRIPDFMQKRYDQAIATLVSIKSGDMILNASTLTLASTGGDQFAWSSVLDADFTGPVFTSAEVWSGCTNPASNRFG